MNSYIVLCLMITPIFIVFMGVVGSLLVTYIRLKYMGDFEERESLNEVSNSENKITLKASDVRFL